VPVLERWTRGIIRFRLIVLAWWLAMLVAGLFSAMRLPGLLSTSLAVPGTGSARANSILAQHFGNNPEGTFTVVFRVGGAPASTVRALSRRVATAARILPDARMTSLHRTNGIVYGDIATRLDLQGAERYTDALRRALHHPAQPPAYLTGPPAIQHDLDPVLATDLRKGETIAIPFALLVLAVVLGIRLLLLVPVVSAACTISAALALVFALAHATLMVSYVPNLVEFIGLGLAIDYSLLFAHRFAEETGRGDAIDEVILRTMATAGRTVVFSGAAAAVGVSVVLITPVPFIRAIGIAGVIVPLVAVAAALTLQPALLSLLGRRALGGYGWPRGVTTRGLWVWWARTVIRRRLILACGATAALAALAIPVAGLRLTPGSLSTIPRVNESAAGLALLRDRVGPGPITPLDVVFDGGAAGRARAPSVSSATLRLGRRLLVDPQVFVVAIGSKAPYVDASGRYGRVIVIPRREFGDEATQRLVGRLRGAYVPAAHFPAGFRVWVGGAPAQGVDFLARVYGTFPWIVVAVLLLTYAVLIRAFRSLLLPLIAVLLDVLSVAATYGLLVVIFRLGVGADLLGLYRASQIEGWVPLFLFATLFGLSMDYQVFLVTRMRESWDAGEDNMGAVAHGVERTGRIITAAAIIMVVAFSGFMAGRVAGLQELGAGLALGVLLDATIVRIVLMPSLMALTGRWNWWLPGVVARLVGTAASPLAERERRGLERSA
jgi:RND superfamily putative drug exporter